MSLRYILGRSGSGKSEACMREIIEAVQDKPLIYIVPEQFSLQAEKNLIGLRRGKAIMNIQVLSFQRLAFRLFSEMGGFGEKVLDTVGKHMLLRKIVYELESKLVFFARSADKQGFTEQLAAAISEFYEYGVTADQLEAYWRALPDKEGLSMKIQDLLEIYRLYQTYIAENYISIDETLDLLWAKIASSWYLEGAEIWLDGFTGFTPQEYKVLEQLLQKASRVTVTFTLNAAKVSFSPLYQTDPFFEVKTSVNRLTQLALSNGIKVEEPVFLPDSPRFQHMPAIGFLEKNFFSLPSEIFPAGKSAALGNAIQLCSSANRYAEIKDAAEEIIELVRERGLRYSEIGVATGALTDYAKGLDSIFGHYGIPFFVDIKTDILSHPLTECIRSAIDVAVHNWSYEAVFRFLKTGLPPIRQEDVDLLENYVLSYGIKGGRWTKPFTLGPEETTEETEMNTLREMVRGFLLPFTDGLRADKKQTVRDFAERLFMLVEHNGLLERIAEDTVGSKLGFQIWQKICETFDKLVDILGQEVMSLKEFSKVVEAGLAAVDLGMIPAAQDQVLIGDLERSRFPKIKALLVLGVNEGILPAVPDEEGLFSDAERLALTAAGLELAPDSRRKAFQEEFLIYCGITRPEEFLYLSYSRGTLDGKTLQPSTLVAKLKKMFPALTEREKQDELLLTLPSPVFGKMGVMMREWKEKGRLDPLFNDLYAWFQASPDYSDKLSKLEELLLGKDPKERLHPKQIKKLYNTNEILTGVSRLEQYVQCPYAYFVRYNLDARERKIYQVQAVDLGNLFHDVLEEVTKLVSEKGMSWRLLTKDEINDLVEEAVQKLAPQQNQQVFLSTERYKYLMKRVTRIAKRSVWALAEHIKRGAFEPLAAELEFRAESPLTGISVSINSRQKFVLTGRIDRIDVMDANGNHYIKIIDYKSGNKKFDMQDIYFGMQLQLLLYMDAFIKNGAAIFGRGKLSQEALLPGGVFYFNIDDPVIDYHGELEDAQLDEKILQAFKMTGLVLADETVVKGLDAEIKGYSDIIPVYLKTDGSFGANSSVADLEEYNKLREFVLNKIAGIGEEMTEGDISVFPYQKGQMNGCSYCNYKGICQFEAVENRNKFHVIKMEQPLIE